MNKDLKIGIIGLGLIGGSIYKELNDKFDVYCCTRNKDTISMVKNAADNLSIVQNCDIIFVCTPMNKTLDILDKLNGILSKDTIVMDVCSLKEFLTNKKYNFKFIPTHPMAGTENNGFDASFKGLFNNAKWAITPLEGTLEGDLEVVKDLIKTLGATPLFTTPQKHDEAVALISHMPMLVAQALYKTVQNDELALNLASTGFKDMTRLAMSNVEMASDMINMNSKNIQDAVLKLYSSVGELLNGDYTEEITKIKLQRKELFK